MHVPWKLVPPRVLHSPFIIPIVCLLQDLPPPFISLFFLSLLLFILKLETEPQTTKQPQFYYFIFVDPIDQGSFKLAILLPQSPEQWSLRPVATCPETSFPGSVVVCLFEAGSQVDQASLKLAR